MFGLTETQVQRFQDEGYLVVEHVLDEATIEAVRVEYAALLDAVSAQLFAEGKVSDTYRHLPFGERYTRLLFEYPKIFDRLDISLPLDNEGKPTEAKAHTGPAVFRMLTHARLLDVVESILGPEIYSNPVQHVRIKPPRKAVRADIVENSYVSNTTWHQDQGALLDEANDTQVLTVWVAITDATLENGCLVSIPSSHKRNMLTLHCPGKGIAAENYIPGPLLETRKATPLPVARGGIILFHRYTEHAAYPNKTDSIRWSFDLRYNPVGQPTGRPAFPGFVARSAAHPETALTGPVVWAQLWHDARQRILNSEVNGPIFNQDRWSGNKKLTVCA